jgi:HAD superfamily hydrolase (TIGR01509 family)
MGDTHREIRGVIFDLDGLMIDSEPLSMEAWQQCLAPHGARLTVDQYRRLIGGSHLNTAREIGELTGLDPETLTGGFWERLLGLIEERGKTMEGLVPLLDELTARGYPLGVASNGPSDYVRRATKTLGIDKYFVCVFGLDDVPNGKPAPDVFLKAASCIGVPPEACLALEDSNTGARAAVAAGMRTIFVPDPEWELPGPAGVHAEFPSLSAFHTELDEMLALDGSVEGT